MSGFKLLAIRPLAGCSSRFRKNLKEGMVYKFYQNYDYYINNDGTEERLTNENFKSFVGEPISRIDPLGNEVDLYSKDDLKINISAIVGENGSGKSSLIELLYVAVFLCNLRRISSHMLSEDKKQNKKNNRTDDKNESLLNPEDNIGELLRNYSNLSKNYSNVHNFCQGFKIFNDSIIKLEIYYQYGNSIYQLSIDSESLEKKDLYQLKKMFGVSNKDSNLSLPFYSIALNYSIHSLNSDDMGKWINSIFHKNDAYQTPLVINPKREAGDINVENEKTLQKSRMLSNTMEIESQKLDLKPLFNDKVIKQITLKFKFPRVIGLLEDPVDIDILNRNNVVDIQSDLIDDKYIKKCKEYAKIFKINKNIEDCNWIEQEAYAYLIRKIERIQNHYHHVLKGEKVEVLKDFDSHITFKLWQTINFINHDNPIKTHYDEGIKLISHEANDENNFKYSTIRNQDKIYSINNEDLNNLYSEDPPNVQDQINYLPPPIFEYDIQFSEDPNDTFDQLSSGEKQQIYSIHTIMYHIRNVASVNKDEEKNIIKFRDINILLDEVELYFHPELQRKFVKRLLDSIKVLSDRLKDNIDSINILFATHSPFILSDIPSSNILRLKNGKPTPIKNESNTFGANIHDLLANDFFLENGFMGEFAKQKINEIVDELQRSIKEEILIPPKRIEEIERIIEIIGEPLLKNSLNNLYVQAVPESKDQFIQKQIDLLTALKNSSR